MYYFPGKGILGKARILDSDRRSKHGLEKIKATYVETAHDKSEIIELSHMSTTVTSKACSARVSRVKS